MRRDCMFNTKVVHAGMADYGHGALVPPIYQTSTFRFRDADHGAELFAGREKGYIYTRMGNPTVDALEKCVADLENGCGALACASGMAAIHTTFISLLKRGDHVLCSQAVYGPTTSLLAQIFSRFGVESTFVDTSDLQAVQDAVRPNTRVVFIETPGNPTLVISDIRRIANIAHDHGALLIVDNTFMSPALQNPIDLGADIVVHSMTKFLNGHADVIGGIVVVTSPEMHTTLRHVLTHIGGVLDPFNAFLVHRGIKTLGLRMERHCRNARRIAEFLEDHKAIRSVSYPGLPSHPQYDIGMRQMRGPGGMISFEVRGGVNAGKRLMNSVRLCTLAVSLGGVETLIQHPASMTHAGVPREQRLKAGITDGLVRLSVGIEDAEDLIADLDQALAQI